MSGGSTRPPSCHTQASRVAGVRVVRCRRRWWRRPSGWSPWRAPPVRPVGVRAVVACTRAGRPAGRPDPAAGGRRRTLMPAFVSASSPCPGSPVAHAVRTEPPASRPSTTTPTQGAVAAAAGADGPSSASSATAPAPPSSDGAEQCRSATDRRHRRDLEVPAAGQSRQAPRRAVVADVGQAGPGQRGHGLAGGAGRVAGVLRGRTGPRHGRRACRRTRPAGCAGSHRPSRPPCRGRPRSAPGPPAPSSWRCPRRSRRWRTSRWRSGAA